MPVLISQLCPIPPNLTKVIGRYLFDECVHVIYLAALYALLQTSCKGEGINRIHKDHST